MTAVRVNKRDYVDMVDTPPTGSIESQRVLPKGSSIVGAVMPGAAVEPEPLNGVRIRYGDPEYDGEAGDYTADQGIMTDTQPGMQNLPQDDVSSFGGDRNTYLATTSMEAEQNVIMVDATDLVATAVGYNATALAAEMFLASAMSDTIPLEQLFSFETTQVQVVSTGAWLEGSADIAVPENLQELGSAEVDFNIEYGDEDVLDWPGLYPFDDSTFVADETRWEGETLVDVEVDEMF